VKIEIWKRQDDFNKLADLSNEKDFSEPLVKNLRVENLQKAIVDLNDRISE
jgi:hypothetical protein